MNLSSNNRVGDKMQSFKDLDPWPCGLVSRCKCKGKEVNVKLYYNTRCKGKGGSLSTGVTTLAKTGIEPKYIKPSQKWTDITIPMLR